MDWIVIPKRLHVEAIGMQAGIITVLASTTTTTASCPVCGHRSRRRHSVYHRRMADLPWAGTPVQFRLAVRKFVCTYPLCRRKVFCERLEGVAEAYARRTARKRANLEEIGFALGGEAGARLAFELGLRTSPDTLLRYMKQASDTRVEPVRVLGIDDWCWRRRLRYGTILVDLERRRVVDLLPDREVESLVEWLKRHPEVETIVRDRGDTYTEAAGKGAPQAVQVVDRWHILRNLTDYLERFLLHHTSLLKGAAQRLEGVQRVELPPAQRPIPRLEEARAASEERHAKYVAAWEEVHRLGLAGADVADIARTVGVSRRTAYRYLGMRDPPERKRPKPRCKLLDPYKEYLVRRWEEGCHNRMRLFREIQEQGYGYSETNVFRFFSELRRSQGSSDGQDSGQSRISVRAPSAHHVATLFVRCTEDLSEGQAIYVERLCESSEEIAKAHELTEDFCAMLRRLEGERLDGWMEAARESQIAELDRFARSLRKDEAAVRAGLSLHWSNGQTEGQVHRLKLVKRQRYGRAGFELLRSRVLHAA